MLQAIIFLIIIWFASRYLLGQWHRFRDQPITPEWGYLIVSQLGMLIGLGLLPVGSWLTLAYLGSSQPAHIVWRIFFSSNIAKYLPGSIWTYPSRVLLYQWAGASLTQSLAAVFWEVFLTVFSASLIALLGIRIFAVYVPTAIIGGILAFMILIGVSLFIILTKPPSRQCQKPIRFLPFFVHQLISRHDARLSFVQVATVIAVYCLSWGIAGLAFACLARAFSPQFTTIWWLEVSGLYMGCWLAGYIVIIAPGGIGVRDSLLVIGLSVMLADPLPAVVAIVARIMWTAAETLAFVLSNLGHLLFRSMNDSNRISSTSNYQNSGR